MSRLVQAAFPLRPQQTKSLIAPSVIAAKTEAWIRYAQMNAGSRPTCRKSSSAIWAPGICEISSQTREALFGDALPATNAKANRASSTAAPTASASLMSRVFRIVRRLPSIGRGSDYVILAKGERPCLQSRLVTIRTAPRTAAGGRGFRCGRWRRTCSSPGCGWAGRN